METLILVLLVLVIALAATGLYLLSVINRPKEKPKFGLDIFLALRENVKTNYPENQQKMVLAGAKLGIQYSPSVDFTAEEEAKKAREKQLEEAASLTDEANKTLDDAEYEINLLQAKIQTIEEEIARTHEMAEKDAADLNHAAEQAKAEAKILDGVLEDLR